MNMPNWLQKISYGPTPINQDVIVQKIQECLMNPGLVSRVAYDLQTYLGGADTCCGIIDEISEQQPMYEITLNQLKTEIGCGLETTETTETITDKEIPEEAVL